jgi:hypothetical protein
VRLPGKRLVKNDNLLTNPERGVFHMEIYTLASIIAVMIAIMVVTKAGEEDSPFTKSARKKR